MNFGQAQSLVSYWLDDLSFGYFTKTQVQQFINNAQREAQQKIVQAGQEWYVSSVQTPTVANAECLQLPDDFLKVNHVELISSGTFPNEVKSVLEHSTHRESDVANYTPGQPVTFFLRKDLMILRPIPDVSTYTLRMDYTYRVSDMVDDGEEIDAPIEYHEYVCILAAIDGFLKDGRDPARFIEKREKYEASLKASSADRAVDKPREVVVTWDDF